MKKLFSLLLFLLVSIPGLSQEKYFHDLRGMEDSTGTTHLFYRIHETINFNCASFDTDTVYQVSTTRIENNIYRINTSNLNNELVVNNSRGQNWTCSFIATETNSLTFFEAHPDSFIAIESFYCCIDASSHEVKDYKSRNFRTQSKNIFFDSNTNHFVFGYNIDATGWDFNLTSLAFSRYDSVWYQDYYFYEYWRETTNVDSLLLPFLIQGINQFDGTYIGSTEDSLVIYQDSSVTGSLLQEYSPTSEFYLPFDSTLIFSATLDGELFKLDKINYGNVPMTETEVFSSDLPFYVFFDSLSGIYVVKQDGEIYHSEDFGESFEIKSLLHTDITGAYIPSRFDELYYATPEEIFKLEFSSIEIASFLTLPVSNEITTEVPSSVVLHQNYPNPFNPVTNIAFELNKADEVKLTIFDVLGRPVATLIDGRRNAGLHTIRFDASGLSSGIYFYRLETKTQSLVKKLTLLK